MPSATDILAPGGILSQRLEGYEHRLGQIRMAELVEAALHERQMLMVEAPTGVGKSLGYSIPVIQHALATRQKAIIATANIALQEQLVYKDLPWLKDHMGQDFNFVLVKGRGNYLCKSRWKEKEDRPEFTQYKQWARITRTGDKSELDFNVKKTWFAISSTGNECIGPKCQYRDICWAQRVKAQAYKADIMVVNYHLLFASWENPNVLPEHHVLICDEAHAMADVARSAQSDQLTVNSLKWLSHQVDEFAPSALNWKVAETVMAEAAIFLGRKAFIQRRYNEGALDFSLISDELERARTRLLNVGVFSDEHHEAKYKRVMEMVVNKASAVRDFQRGSTDFRVCWAEMQTRDHALVKFSPISVADYISSHLKAPSVLTSATLTTGGNFRFVKNELGLASDAVEERIPYTFDYENQGRLYIPPLNVEPNHPDFLDSVSAELKELVPAVEGGVLILCTSNKAMNQYTTDLRTCGWSRSILMQGDSSRRLLMEKMKAEHGTVLVATRSFFEGVDIPGEALECVVIDKLPFPVPSDPVIQSIQEKIKRDTDKNGWFEYSLPLCGMIMAQASGRLLRRSTDKGIVMICDSRMRSRGYKSFIRKSMPPFKRTVRRESIISFLSGE